MKTQNSFLKRSVLAVVLAGVLGSSALFSIGRATSKTNASEEQQVVPEVKNAVGTYYDGISSSSTGTTLLSSLRSLNGTKRTSTVGYSNFGSYYPQTDGDPNNSSNLIVFYSGTSSAFSGSFSGSINREHVWPNSRGGSYVEGDIHMPRPTLVSENGSRGNSFYVEGQKSSSTGWDPAMESFGKEKYRGISARIIFYCVVASSNLSLVDTTNDDTGNNTMGKLSDLLKWNLNYGIDTTETKRNEAAQTIQGNRNPFIDHPEYACKIWGDYNDATRTVCAASATPSVALDKSTATIYKGNNTTLVATVSNSSSTVSWSSSNTNVATVTSGGLVAGVNNGSATITASIVDNSVTYSATCDVTVQTAPANVPVTGVTLDKSTSSIYVGGTTSLTATIAPTNATTQTLTWSTTNSAIASLSATTGSAITVTGAGAGTATITATTTDGGYYASCSVTVSTQPSSGATDTITSSGLSLAASYTNYSYSSSASGASYTCYGYSGSGSTIQMNSTKNAGFITTVSGGTLQSVTFNWSTSTTSGRSVNIYGSNSAYSSTASSSIQATTSLGSVTYSGTTSMTYTFSSNYAYFAFMPVGGALYFTNIVVNWAASTPTLSSISISSNPTKTVYTAGESLDLTGLVVDAYYTDGSSVGGIVGYTTDPVNGATLSTIGTQTVTVSHTDSGVTQTTSFNVTVNRQQVALTSVTLNTSSVTLDINGTTTLTATIAPENIYPAATIAWSTSSSSIATVVDGLVTAVNSGSATITATATQNSITKIATCTINVNELPFVPTTTYGGGSGATLVTDSSTLASGDQIVIATPTYNMGLGAASSSIRTNVAVTISGSNMTSLGSATVLTLGGSTGAWTLSNGTDYLYFTGTANALQTGTSSSSGNTWNISIVNGSTTISNVAAPTRTIQYNSSSPRFACYTTAQKPVSIYKLAVGGYNYNYILDMLDGDYCSCTLDELNTLYSRYVLMTQTEINHLNNATIIGKDSKTYTGLQAYEVAMARRDALQNQATKDSIFDTNIDHTTVIALITIITLIGASSIGAYFYLRKRNEQ